MLPGRKKNTVRIGYGTMCNICGLNCGRGGALKAHLAGAHQVDYDTYRKCFYSEPKNIIADSWDDSVSTSRGNTVITLVLVRRFVGNTGKRGARQTAK